MSDTKVTFTGNADQFLSEHKKVVEAKDKDIAKIRQLLSESKKYHSEDGKLQREAATALEKTRTAQQVYNDQVQKWFNLMAQGKRTLAEFNTLKGEEKKKLDENTAAIKRQREATLASVKAKRDDYSSSLDSIKGNSGLGESFTIITAAIAAATAGLKAFAEERKRMQTAGASGVKTIDDLSREYAIQGGLLTDDQRKVARDKIMDVAIENAATPQMAFSTASQLASSGFKDSDGETLDSALKILATSDMAKADPKVFIDGAARYLTASNKELSGKALLELGVKLRGIADTPVQASDLAQFADAAPVLELKGVDFDTGLGMMTELRKRFSGGPAGIAMRNIGLRLGKLNKDNQSLEALDAMGISVDDVDGVGESMPEALKRIKVGVDKMPSKDQIGIMSALFTSENVAPANALMEAVSDGSLDKTVKALGNKENFRAGVDFALSGGSADERRSELRNQKAQVKNEDTITRREWVDRRLDEQYTEQWNKVENSDKLTGGQKMFVKAALFSKRVAMKTAQMGFENEDFYGDDATVNQVIDANQKSSFSGAELDRRLSVPAAAVADPQAAAMAENNAILKNIAGNQARVAEAVVNPANRPTVNPVITGRPK